MTTELSCYTANLAAYLAGDHLDVRAHIARSVRLAEVAGVADDRVQRADRFGAAHQVADGGAQPFHVADEIGRRTIP